MGSTRQPRRSDTRQRIQDVALELFAEQGYEKTSLREIAERLDVTKAALYYHFRTKEDILASVFEDVARPIDELIEWARPQPRDLATGTEVLRRYGELMDRAAPLFRFLHENQAAVRELRIGEGFKERSIALVRLLLPEHATPVDQVRCLSALFTLHSRMFALRHLLSDPEEQRTAALAVAVELITAAHATDAHATSAHATDAHVTDAAPVPAPAPPPSSPPVSA
ncbi:TetR/AcrR family transcriptional regulator [Streptomyces sp. 4N509B]|uniref:TetR/AcrR family transcriptional regulator n=1 Tax=Streptomyces sp. 4N509B TaxID=3457413 RepID=UPI003FD60950